MTAEAVVLDTDVVSRLMRGSLPDEMGARLAGAEPYVAFITVGELFRGAVHARWGTRRVAALDDWLARVETIAGEANVARTWGAITGRALAEGRPLPANDAWVAACCVTHDLALATLNRRDYACIEGLDLVSGR